MIPKEKMVPTAESEALTKELKILEADLEVMGWDQDGRVYAIYQENPTDFRLELMTKLEGAHPLEFFHKAITLMGRLADDIVGLALSIEGWRHPTIEEVEEDYPELWEFLMELARRCGFNTDDPDDNKKVYEHIQNVLTRQFQYMPPSANPNRKEIRTVTAILRDGDGATIYRTRGTDAEVVNMLPDGRVAKAMKAMFTGKWPDDIDPNP